MRRMQPDGDTSTAQVMFTARIIFLSFYSVFSHSECFVCSSLLSRFPCKLTTIITVFNTVITVLEMTIIPIKTISVNSIYIIIANDSN